MKRKQLPQSAEYKAWSNAIQRCENARHISYRNYGGRGIRVSPAWRNSFRTFLADMGPRPSPVHSLERDRVNEDYGPGNCRWATRTEQARNTRVKNPLGVTGLFYRPTGKIRAVIGVGYELVQLGQFDNVFDAACARKSAENRLWN